jgi:hypothetical protein
MASAALELVVGHLISTNMLRTQEIGMTTAFADDETLSVARTLCNCVMQRLISDHVMREAERRSLLPVTIYSLSSLLCDAIALYKTK